MLIILPVLGDDLSDWSSPPWELLCQQPASTVRGHGRVPWPDEVSTAPPLKTPRQTTCYLAVRSQFRQVLFQLRLLQGLNWGIPPDLSSPTSALRSATCNLGSNTLKYRSGTFLMGSTTVKHGILTVRWIHVSAQRITIILNEQQAEII